MVTPVRLVASSIAVLLLAGSASAQLQLFPRASTYSLDGVTFPQLAFKDGNAEVTYVPPRGWSVTGSDSKLVLRPANTANAEATVVSTPLKENGNLSFDDEAVKNLTTEALAAVPAESTNVQVLSQQVNPVRISGKDTFLLTLSYTFGGENYARSVMFMNRPTSRVIFQLLSKEKDFADLQKAFLGSHFTWHNL